MTFTCTYRDPTGAIRSEILEASARVEVFGVLKRRGIVPLSVKEGGKIPSRDPGRAGGARRSGRSALISGGIVVVLLAVVLVVVCLHSGGDGSGSASRKSTPQIMKRRPGAEKAGDRAKTPVSAPRDKDMGTPAAPEVGTAAPGGDSSADDMPALPTPTANVPPPSVPPPPPTFEAASDQVIAMALQADEHGMAPMPLSGDLEREFLESLKREIVILDTDDEQTRALKESVIATRAEIKRLMDGGMSFNQVMQEHQKLANENAKIRNDATLELKRILDSGDVEGAKAYKRKINIALGQMGIKGLSVAVTDEEREERAVARRERMLERRARQAAQAEAAAALRAAQQGK